MEQTRNISAMFIIKLVIQIYASSKKTTFCTYFKGSTPKTVSTVLAMLSQELIIPAKTKKSSERCQQDFHHWGPIN